ncbi:hypothetical protein M409DRAFT_19389 [Zasmidium cellare ATCC 36951]|uniref:SprT-like domain-containing protein n=1 Tax=Zasmidium cellare ATCC 36951 TaxID=1080233 RepID=A0A6A6CU08_ZASCE|nr:uncharacterized protein M409DRAFT_19389 [Zasmidium cellare ATCC 36951]KAF2170571.1 hypothetical protein M409DRAFT_19389 [Zasmidium cellare ATCC 36951]
MARLRGNANADAAEDSHVPRRRVQRQPDEARKQIARRRRSSNDDESQTWDADRRKASASLVLKDQSVPQTKKTQVRLGGLQALSSSNSLTSGLNLEDLTKDEPRKRRVQRASPKKSILENPAKSAFERLDGPMAEDKDEEESIWCGSIDASDSSSGEELISPRKLFGLPRKPVSSTKTGPNLTRQLQALTIFDDDDDGGVPSKKRVPRSKKTDITARPLSSSDKENHEAIIRFSPPQARGLVKTAATDRTSTPPPPASPSKSRLQSPSKKATRIPTPPLRPSLDAFWTADAINDWNDQYSPQKPLKSPRKLKLQPNPEDQSPSTSPKKLLQSPSKRTKADLAAIKDFNARKVALAESFLHELDQTITQGRIQSLSASTGGVQLLWSNTLNSTAGRANWRRETTKSRSSETLQHKHFASIELATKVISAEHRLLNVIAHEFCHLANFMISGVKDQPHGKQFKEWGRQVTGAFGERGVEVTTKHSYEIEYKYVWRCVEEGECGMEFKRHSKSIDPGRQRCGRCRGLLVQVKPVPRKENSSGGGGVGTTATPGKGYAGFVKVHFAEVKKGMPGRSHKEVMEALGRKYRAEKEGSGKSVDDMAGELGEMKLGGGEGPVVIDAD